MGLFRRKPREAEANLAPPDTPPDWRETDRWRLWEPPLNVVRGESYRQDELRRLAGPPRDEGWLVPVDASLVRDRRNRHDRNAIRVEVEGHHVGYIAREMAAILAPRFDAYKVERLSVPAIIRGGRIVGQGMALIVEGLEEGKPRVTAEESTEALDLGIHLWLNRRLIPGPVTPLESDVLRRYEVPWPPHDHEGQRGTKAG